MILSRNVREDTYLVCLIFLLVFLQILTIKVGTTDIDVSWIVTYLLIIKLAFNQKKVSKLSLLFIILGVFSTILSLVNEIPFYRVISVWIFIVFPVFIWLQSIVIYVDLERVKRMLYLLLFFQSFLIFGQYFSGIGRPSGTFSEPSPAGLVLYAGIIFALFDGDFKLSFPKLSFIGMLLISAFLTRSAHLATFVVFLTILFAINLNFKALFALAVVLVIAFLLQGFFTVGFYDRITLNSESGNLSVFVWLRSVDSFLFMLDKSPFFGFGAGSSGFVDFPSEFEDSLSDIGAEDLNKFDLYSGFFRLAFELGLISLAVLIYRFFFLVKTSINFHKDEVSGVILFSMMVFLGILVKEPVWSKSLISIFVIGSMLNDFRKRSVTSVANPL